MEKIHGFAEKIQMKTALIFISLSIVVIILVFMVLAILSRFLDPPGLSHKKLAECPKKPNCVCSEYKNDSGHYIDPINLNHNNGLKAFSILNDLIKNMGGRIQSEEAYYMNATFSSKVFGFVDDLQLRLDVNENKIHIRSSSRVGYSDGDVNRRRVEMLKALFKKHLLSDCK